MQKKGGKNHFLALCLRQRAAIAIVLKTDLKFIFLLFFVSTFVDFTDSLRNQKELRADILSSFVRLTLKYTKWQNLAYKHR